MQPLGTKPRDQLVPHSRGRYVDQGPRDEPVPGRSQSPAFSRLPHPGLPHPGLLHPGLDVAPAPPL